MSNLFYLKNKELVKKRAKKWALKNLQPLWANDNYSKGGKYNENKETSMA